MKIAYITNGFTSGLNCSYELSHRLVEAGHEVIYISPVDIVSRTKENGFTCILLKEEQALENNLKNLSATNLVKIWQTKREIINTHRKNMFAASELTSTLKSVKADVTLIDIELHYVIIVCSSLNLPCILLSPWFSIFQDGTNLPPLHTTLNPPQNKKQCDHIKMLWTNLTRAKKQRQLRYRFKNSVKQFLSPKALSYQTLNPNDLERLAKHRGFDFNKNIDLYCWLRPFSFKHLPILVFNMAEMDFPHNPDSRLNYVGLMIHHQRRDPESTDLQESALFDLLHHKKTGENTNPLIYCSLGTFWKTDTTFLQTIIDVFKVRRDWQLIIGLGGKSKPADFSSIPENVTLLEWAPQLEILKQADCVITHGGISTINECVFHKVPMLVYSTEHGDQNGCAARVAWHGLGITGNKISDNTKTIKLHLDHLLQSESIRIKLGEMQMLSIKYKTDNLAVNLITQVATSAIKDKTANV